MEQQADIPIGSPPAYSEIVKYDSSAIPCGQDTEEQMRFKQPQYTWADACPSAEPSQYPSVPAGPAPYLPAYGQPIYYQQSGCGMPYYGVTSQQPQPQQPQQVVLVDGQQQPVILGHVQSFAGHIVLACVVIICCNCIIGIIALIIAGNISTCHSLATSPGTMASAQREPITGIWGRAPAGSR